MASRQIAPPPAPRLYLVTPAIEDATSVARDLTAMLTSDVAAVLVRLAPADERTLINRVKALVPLVQARGAALVLDGHADIVARTGADGAHLTGIDALNAAIGSLKPERIAGVGGITSRHDAMLAGEAGADYVMFGEPDTRGRRPPFDAVVERVTWWAEVFELPCVGFAQYLDEAAALARAGADFVAVDDFVWTADPGAALRAAAASLVSEPVR